MNTSSECEIGGVVKYMNILIEVGVRPNETSGTSNDGVGWVEWAFVCVKQTETSVPNTNIGVRTLGDVCTKMYRNECIYTGCIPASRSNPNCSMISIKIPQFKQKLVMGDEWRLYVYYRDVLTTAMGTDSARVLVSTNFKSYQ